MGPPRPTLVPMGLPRHHSPPGRMCQGQVPPPWPHHGAGATHSVFMLRMARRDMIAAVTAFLNCLRGGGGGRAEGWLEPEAGVGGHHNIPSPHGQVHGADGEEREGVDLDHDGHEGHVEEDLDEACREEGHQEVGLGPPRSHGLMLLASCRLRKLRRDLQGHVVSRFWPTTG